MLFWNMTLTFLQKEMGIYVPSPWAKWTFVSASTNRSERNDTAWLPRLGHKGNRESIWLPCSQSTYPWNSATMLWGSSGHMGRPHGGTRMTRRSWTPADGQHHERGPSWYPAQTSFQISTVLAAIWWQPHQRPRARLAQLSPADPYRTARNSKLLVQAFTPSIYLF